MNIEMELLVATHNEHKKEIQQILGNDCMVKSLTDYNIHEEIVEDGDSFHANA
jgi:XTP/dITP diphosphohydrolase